MRSTLITIIIGAGGLTAAWLLMCAVLQRPYPKDRSPL